MPVSKISAARVVQELIAASNDLLKHPRLGEMLELFETLEVRRIFVGDYEMRYEILQSTIYILRLWHSREDK